MWSNINVKLKGLFILLYLPLCTFSQNINSALTADDFHGEWYGYYDMENSTDPMLTVLVLRKVAHNKVKGAFIWSDYFNSKTLIEGELKNDTLTLRETKLLQGYERDLSGKYVFTLDNSSKKRLTGSFINARVSTAKLSLTLKKELPESKASAFKQKIFDNIQRYGTTTFSPVSETLRFEDIHKKYKELYFPDTPRYKVLEASGSTFIKDMKLPISLVATNDNRQFVKIKYQGQDVLLGRVGSEEWKYEPIKGELLEYEVALSELSTFNYLQNQLAWQLKNGFTCIKIENAHMDSSDCYKLVFQKEDTIKALYLDKNTFQLRRKDHNYKMILYSGFQETPGGTIPFRKQEIGLNAHNLIILNHFDFKPEVDTTLFKIPGHLQHKRHRIVSESEVHNEKGIQHYENQKFEKAISEFTQAIRIQPEAANYYLNRGMAKYEVKDYYGAISDYTQCLERNPLEADALNRRGLAKYQLKDLENALVDFSKVIALDSNHIDGITNRAYTHFEMKEYEKANHDFSRLIVLDSNNTQFYVDKAVTLAELAQYEEALTYYNQAIELGNEDSDLYNYRGVTYYALGNFALAQQDFAYAFSKDSSDYIKAQNLGDALFELKKYEAAKEAYTQAMNVTNPQSGKLHYTIGLCHYYQEDYAMGIRYFSQAIEQNPREASYFDYRARSYMNLSQYTEAIEDYSSSINFHPNDAQIYLERGTAKIALHNKHDGCRDFKKAQEMGNEEADKMIEEYCNYYLDE
ncbi:tetratricopeptide repeat protein [Rapidithrix thailandica]|uniref:Tetratricopeptide repeat protein n=1 Tax=Rapidithrix thailandica TaxID=413964 RepID=A0AAW9S020_9BACT